jgi:hypothetical protein
MVSNTFIANSRRVFDGRLPIFRDNKSGAPVAHATLSSFVNTPEFLLPKTNLLISNLTSRTLVVTGNNVIKLTDFGHIEHDIHGLSADMPRPESIEYARSFLFFARVSTSLSPSNLQLRRTHLDTPPPSRFFSQVWTA